MLWLANMVRGNSQQVRIASGPEMLSIRKNELEYRKSWRKNQIRDRKAIKKLCRVVMDQSRFGVLVIAVIKIEVQAKITINIEAY